MTDRERPELQDGERRGYAGIGPKKRWRPTAMEGVVAPDIM